MRSLTLTSAAVMAIAGDTRNVSDVDESRVIKATMHTPVAFWRSNATAFERLHDPIRPLCAEYDPAGHSAGITARGVPELGSATTRRRGGIDRRRPRTCPSRVPSPEYRICAAPGARRRHGPVPASRGLGRLPAPRVQSPRHITYCRLISPAIDR